MQYIQPQVPSNASQGEYRPQPTDREARREIEQKDGRMLSDLTWTLAQHKGYPEFPRSPGTAKRNARDEPSEEQGRGLAEQNEEEAMHISF